MVRVSLGSPKMPGCSATGSCASAYSLYVLSVLIHHITGMSTERLGWIIANVRNTCGLYRFARHWLAWLKFSKSFRWDLGRSRFACCRSVRSNRWQLSQGPEEICSGPLVPGLRI